MNFEGIAIVLLLALLGLGFVVVSFVLSFVGIFARKPKRGIRASGVAFGLAAVAVLLSSPFWQIVLTGLDSHGDPIRYDEAGPFIAVVVVEGLCLALSAIAVLRQLLRKKTS